MQSALFNFQSLLLVFLLIICTSTYAHSMMPGIMDRNQSGFFGIFWKCARIGERLSPYVSICCVVMAVSILSTFPEPTTSLAWNANVHALARSRFSSAAD
ncbi:DUF1242-domain-containing protein [Aspergillus niger ATCC 13496]|uniref:Protein kish n=3 Tax=Aspergillus niger TaxID=5061 RepID=A0A370CCH8_ASPNG|nr:DUF1242-domain-containing protein [Aspergillus niger ATCC 13496]